MQITVNSKPVMVHIMFSSEQHNIFRELNCLQKLAEDVVWRSVKGCALCNSLSECTSSETHLLETIALDSRQSLSV